MTLLCVYQFGDSHYQRITMNPLFMHEKTIRPTGKNSSAEQKIGFKGSLSKPLANLSNKNCSATVLNVTADVFEN